MYRLTYILFLLCIGLNIHGQQVQEGYVVETFRVLFESGKATVHSSEQANIKQAFVLWEKDSLAFIWLRGHTDDIGDAEDNIALSIERVLAVKNTLEGHGVSSQDIHIDSYGEEAPFTKNTSAKGRRQNRRVTIRVMSFREFKEPEKLVWVKGYIIDREDDEPIEAAKVLITVHGEQQELFTDEDGYYEIQVPDTSEVRIDVLAEGYFIQSQAFRGGTKRPTKVSLPPAVPGSIFPINNLHFYGDQARLLPGSREELPGLLLFMQVNSLLRIEIAGHINGIMYPVGGEPSSKFQLSVNRAKTIYNFLVENGIDPDRLTYRGYGNRQMRYPSPFATSRQQAVNRRVEIRIL
ncbi:MAG: OmpA family protein [Bacteroidia bacterium]